MKQQTVSLPIVEGGHELDLYPKLLMKSNGELGFLLTELAPLLGIPEHQLSTVISEMVASLQATDLGMLPTAQVDRVNKGDILTRHLSKEQILIQENHFFISLKTLETLRYAILEHYRSSLQLSTQELEKNNNVIKAIYLISGIQNVIENADLFSKAFKKPNMCQRIRIFFKNLFCKKTMILVVLLTILFGFSPQAWAI